MNRVERRFFFIASSAMVATTAAMAVSIAHRNQGTFTYALDDPYISLAMARNLAEHGTYGVSPGVYESASSSPAWVLVLAAFWLVLGKATVYVPLVLNTAASILLIRAFSRLEILTTDLQPVRFAARAALLPLALFLPGLAIIGLEHGVHAWLCVLILSRIHSWGSTPRPWRSYAITCALIALSVAVRPEGMFLVAGVSFAEWIASERRTGLQAVLRGAAPIAAGGLVVLALAWINLSHGQFAAANSVVAKSGILHPIESAIPSIRRLHGLHQDPMLLAEVLFMLALLLRGRSLREPWARAGLVFLSCTALHLAYSDTGAMHRYHSYLVVMGAFACLWGAAPHPSPLPLPSVAGEGAGRSLAAEGAGGSVHSLVGEGAGRSLVAEGARSYAGSLLLMLLILMPLRKYGIQYSQPAAANDIYRQHGSMGRFLSTYYDGQGVAARDIGMVSFLHRGPVVDLLGLGSHELLKARLENRQTPEFIAQYLDTHGVKVIATYPSSLPKGFTGWEQVATWHTPPSGAMSNCSEDAVSFYARQGEDSARLASQLREYEPRLPLGVGSEYLLDAR